MGDTRIINVKTGEVHITGPVTKQEKVKWERLRNRKHECLVGIRELKELQKEMPDHKSIQSEIEFEQQIRYYGATATRSESGPPLNSGDDQQPCRFRTSP